MPSRRVDSDTAIHRSRRVQLIEAAIEVIADVGAERATISRIADHAAVSRGVVTYHFRDRATLFDAVVTHVYDLAHAALDDRVNQATSSRVSLREFITGSLDFYAQHAGAMTALSAIYRLPDMPRSQRAEHQTEMSDVAETLAAGMASGEFRRCDIRVMAATIRAGLDAALTRVRAGADVEHEKTEMWSLVDAATRADAPR
jgi:AcrR family transcriptional regulator